MSKAKRKNYPHKSDAQKALVAQITKPGKQKVQKTIKSKKYKYNWPQEKEAFFNSDYLEVKTYFEAKHGKYNGTIAKMTTGWQEEKKQWLRDIAEAHLEEMKKGRIVRLSNILDRICSIADRELKKMDYGDGYYTADAKQIKSYYEIIRTELGLPVRIIHAKTDVSVYDGEKVKRNLIKKLNNEQPNESA